MDNIELLKIIERIKTRREYKDKDFLGFKDIETTEDIEDYKYKHGYDVLIENIADFYMDYVFEFCSCGIPVYAYKKAVEILDLIEHRRDSGDYENPIDKKLMDLLDKDYSILYMVYHFDALELTEHGSSIYGSWITEYGKDFIRIMKEYYKEEFEEIEKRTDKDDSDYDTEV